LFKSWSPGRSGGATTGKAIFTCVYVEKKIFSRISKPISIKLCANHFFMKRIKNCPNKEPFKMGDNQENAKWGEVIEKSSQDDPLSRNTSDLHESFLT
jgi:hypothetical protein